MSNVAVVTHGCRLNIAEGAAIAAMLDGQDDLIVVNSCAVTAEAVATARKAIRRARRAHPAARIVVTGCAAEIEPAMFADLAELVANSAKLDRAAYARPNAGDPAASVPPAAERPAARWISAFAAGAAGGDGDPISAGPIRDRARHARVFLPVQNGCDHRCTFCVIPFGRGPSRSLPAGGAIGEIQAAIAAGAREIVLTGVDLTAYGADLPGRPTLGKLVERILRHAPGLARLRLSSLDPCEIDDQLAELIAFEPRLMPHLHLSLQAGDDLILKRMKRRHSRAQAVALVARLKALRPDLAIGADLIAGFPTEDEAAFANSQALIEECEIVFAHVFPYSPRPGTPAARMPQVDRTIVRARAARLRAAGEGVRRAWLERQIGTVQDVLVEMDGTSGHAANFARVTVPAADPNSIVKVRIAAVAGDMLVGERP